MPFNRCQWAAKNSPYIISYPFIHRQLNLLFYPDMSISAFSTAQRRHSILSQGDAPVLDFYRHSGKILVTGGAGFIGSALIHALNQWGCENILITDFFGKNDKWKNLNPLRFDDCLPADRFLYNIEKSPDFYGAFGAVFHLGACSSTMETDFGYLLENNYSHTLRLTEWALSRGTRFVYASSAATYGDGSQGLDDKNENLSVYRPLNPYGYSKQLFDVCAQKRGFLKRIVGIKYFNVFGPNEYHKGEMRSLVCKAYDQILNTGTIQLFKSYRPEYQDGEQKRDFIYIRDAVNMTLYLAASANATGLFNVGANVARSWLDLANAIFAALKMSPRIEFIEMPESIRSQYQYYTLADISKMRLTGYSYPTTSLEDAIQEYITVYLTRGIRLGDESLS